MGATLAMPLLFSYGTLQEAPVQLGLFGRTLRGQNDVLVGFELSLARIEQPRGISVDAGGYHVNIVATGRVDSQVRGMVFEITDADLAAVDQYENLDGYQRMAARLASGKVAWVYAYARIDQGAGG